MKTPMKLVGGSGCEPRCGHVAIALTPFAIATSAPSGAPAAEPMAAETQAVRRAKSDAKSREKLNATAMPDLKNLAELGAQGPILVTSESP